MDLQREIKLLQLQVSDTLRKIKAKSVSWGQLLGDIRDQKDLMKYFDLKQNLLKSGRNIKTVNGESLLGSGDLTVTGTSTNKQIFHWWGGNWNTTNLGNYYYISFNSAAIEGLNNSISASMNGRNKGLFIAPFNCKIKRVIFKEGGSGSYTGAFVLASGLPNYGGTWNNGYTNVVTHLNQAISATGYEQHKNEFLVMDNITVPKGYAVCPMLVFSAQAGATKVGVEISIEIEEVI